MQNTETESYTNSLKKKKNTNKHIGSENPDTFMSFLQVQRAVIYSL